MSLTRTAAVLACAALTVVGAATTASADGDGRGDERHEGEGRPYSFAVIGDVPYGADQIAAFPRWIAQINAAKPRFTVHVGDIKDGKSRCDDAYYRQIKADFDLFSGPLVYTPGDNEWTDCHRTTNGAYNPLERLAFDRSVFFPRPGWTLGAAPMKVASQARLGFPENTSWRAAGIDFATMHVVGSNDDLQPWTGLGKTTPTPEQSTEEAHRMAAAIAQVRTTFADARKRHDRAVMLFLQADMFDPSYTPTPNDIGAFAPLVQTLVRESECFDGQVYLVNGDSHAYTADHPLAAGSRWLATYGAHGSADNLTRITVDGSTNNKDWLKVTVSSGRARPTVSWERIPYTA